jgi:hypothetical protein
MRKFEVGEEVLIREMAVVPGKFNLRFKGPQLITKKLSDYNYLVQNLEHPNRQQRVIHVDRMKSWNKEGINKENNASETNIAAVENNNKTPNHRYNLRPNIKVPIRFR